MNKKGGNMKKLIIICLSFMFLSGCISRSVLMDDATIPNACKLYLECLYLNKENKDKSICAPMSDSCDKILIYETCAAKYPAQDDYQKLQNCINALD